MVLQQTSHQDHIGQRINAIVFGHLGGGDGENGYIVSGDGGIDQGSVIVDLPAGDNAIHVFLQGGQIHGDQHIRGGDDGAANGGFRQNHIAVSGAAAHFRAVGRKPGNLQIFHQTFVGQKFTGKEDTLAAEAGDEDLGGFHFPSSFAADLSLYTPMG